MPDLTPESPSALSPLVRRVVANNPGLMTGPGTNTYLVGIDEVAVIDPGPDLAAHVDAIIGASMLERVRWILLTHTHPDHWPAAAKIRKKTGAQIAGFAPFPKADEVTHRARHRARRRRHDRRHRVPARGAAHARPRAEPSVLLARRGARAVHRRSRAQRHDDGRQPAARRRHDPVPRVARPAAQAQARRAHLPRARRRDGGSGRGARRVRRAPQDARAPDPQAAEGEARDDPEDRRARSTPTRPTASSRWRSARCTRTSSS